MMFQKVSYFRIVLMAGASIFFAACQEKIDLKLEEFNSAISY
jgi:hypothetical protein